MNFLVITLGPLEMTKNKFRKAVVLFKNERAGLLEEVKDGYRFTYDSEFIKKKNLFLSPFQ